jgi:hypothetical protein
MKKICILILFALFLSATAMAESVSFVPRAWVGISDYQFKQSSRPNAMPDGSDFPEVKFDAVLLMAGLGLTTAYDSYYLDFSYQDSSKEHDKFTQGDFYEKFTGDRHEFSATLGMKVFDNQGSVYVGYKEGKTSGHGHKGTDLTFKEDGFFVGLNYGWVIADTGLFAINAAYAELDGNLKEIPGPIYPASLGMDADNDTEGLSYGVSWTSRINEQWGYSISLDVNDYDFTNLKDNSTTTPLPDKIRERLYTGKISLYYVF